MDGAEGGSALIDTCTADLVAAQNQDGGWGAEPGRTSNTEATALAVLALAHAKLSASPVQRGLQWLAARQTRDGSWALMDGLEAGSWTTSLAVFCLAHFKAHRRRAVNGAGWLLRQRGAGLGWLVSFLYVVFPEAFVGRSNPNLKGWSWTAGTYSWVEPTAYALLAVKKLRASLPPALAGERVNQAELMIYDRMCAGGGWNYGSSSALEVNLPAYPETTALALIALQDRRDAKANSVSLDVLEAMRPEAGGGLALGWATHCLALYGRDAAAWKRALEATYGETRFLGATKTIALALLVAVERSDVFRV